MKTRPSCAATPSGCCSRTPSPVPSLIAELEQIAAGDRRHGVDRRQLHCANRVGFGVRDIKRVAFDREPRRLRERRLHSPRHRAALLRRCPHTDTPDRAADRSPRSDAGPPWRRSGCPASVPGPTANSDRCEAHRRLRRPTRPACRCRPAYAPRAPGNRRRGSGGSRCRRRRADRRRVSSASPCGR